jgi:hypothetical protein
MKIINTVMTLADVKSGEVYIFKHEGKADHSYHPTYEVSVADDDEALGTFWTEEKAREYAEFVERKIERKKTCRIAHLLYSDKDAICGICGKPFNEDF